MNVFRIWQNAFSMITPFMMQDSNAKVGKVTISPVKSLKGCIKDEKKEGGIDDNNRPRGLVRTVSHFEDPKKTISATEEGFQENTKESKFQQLRRTKSFLAIRDLKKGTNVKIDLNKFLEKRDKGYLMKECKRKILNSSMCILYMD